MAPLPTKSPPVVMLDEDDFDSPKLDDKRRQHYVHHHSFQPFQAEIMNLSIVMDQESIDHLVRRSIALVLRHDGFTSADPVAMESFRALVEECWCSKDLSDIGRLLTRLDILHFCASIRQSMQACRRVQAIPQDFEYALRAHDITLESLLPHLNPPVPISVSQISLPTPPPEPTSTPTFAFLGPELNDVDDRPSYIPAHFPPLPSKHTYKATPVFTKREQDPRKIREKATEEGRLGEEALRRITASSRKENGIWSRSNVRRGCEEDSIQSMWEKTVQGVFLIDHNGLKKRQRRKPQEVDVLMGQFGGKSIELSTTPRNEDDVVMGNSGHKAAQDPATLLANYVPPPIVNAERRYWMKHFQEGVQVQKPTKEKVAVAAQDSMVIDS
jgi:hypothetical protein